MTPQERDIITQFVERATRGGGQPIDQEADRLLAELFARYPEARYRIAQTAFIQEHALAEAQNRIRQLEWQLQNQAGMQGQPQQPQQSRGFLGGLFGGGQPQPQAMRPMGPPPQPIQAPNAAALQQAQGRPGFLGTAAMTAAGVVGGVLLGNAIAGWMSGSSGSAQAASQGAGQAAGQPAGPWGAPAENAGGFTQGVGADGGAKSPWAAEEPNRYQDQGGYSGMEDGGQDDGGGFDGGGFDGGGDNETW
ncbi:MAG: DUF2076 domain-containing protein [Alphaproteobacteria bacterium]|nr:DUF2076 domain-containing protein [Alphaproteobacteria bacterium]